MRPLTICQHSFLIFSTRKEKKDCPLRRSVEAPNGFSGEKESQAANLQGPHTAPGSRGRGSGASVINDRPDPIGHRSDRSTGPPSSEPSPSPSAGGDGGGQRSVQTLRRTSYQSRWQQCRRLFSYTLRCDLRQLADLPQLLFSKALDLIGRQTSGHKLAVSDPVGLFIG